MSLRGQARSFTAGGSLATSFYRPDNRDCSLHVDTYVDLEVSAWTAKSRFAQAMQLVHSLIVAEALGSDAVSVF